MDKQTIRLNLFGPLLKAVIDHCKEHFWGRPEILEKILEDLGKVAISHGVSLKELLDAFNPELKDYLDSLPSKGKRRPPRKWDNITHGEREALIARYLLFYYFGTTEFGIDEDAKMFKKLDRFARDHTCVEKGLRRDVSGSVAKSVFDICLTRRQQRRLLDLPEENRTKNK
jgi:hypothetical protein